MITLRSKTFAFLAATLAFLAATDRYVSSAPMQRGYPTAASYPSLVNEEAQTASLLITTLLQNAEGRVIRVLSTAGRTAKTQAIAGRTLLEIITSMALQICPAS
jgi:hypothetical protein